MSAFCVIANSVMKYYSLMKKYLLLLSAAISLSVYGQQQPPMLLWYDRPADYFEESLPIGNGKLGALVYGGVTDNTIYLNDITLWTGKPVDPQLDAGASRWIPEIRKALFNEDYALADSLQLHVQGPNSQFYQPLGTLHIIDDNGIDTPTDYRRELTLDSALCRDSYTLGDIHYTREYFASNPDKLIAIHINSDKKGGINCHLNLTAQVPHKVKSYYAKPEDFGGCGTYIAHEGGMVMSGHAVGSPDESIHFCCTMLAKISDGHISGSDSTLIVKNASDLTIYIINETSFNGAANHPVSNGASYLDNLNDDTWHTANYTYEQFRDNHIADYRQYYDRLRLYLDDDQQKTSQDLSIPTDSLLKRHTDNGGDSRLLETLYFQYGRYLLISSSRTPEVPANLQGLWANKLYSPWRGNYTVNINLEENYWPAEVANLSEMTTPLWGFMQSLANNGRHVAQNYYGIDRGWCSSHNSDIWAMANPVGEKRESPEWSNWNLGGAWLSQALWEHYQFTQDKEFLQQTAYPLLKGASEFCLDWLIDNPFVKGELITAPSTSPENEYKTTEGYHGTTCYGGTADLAIIRELLKNTIAASKTLGVDKKFRREAEASLRRLRPYTIGHEGDINEWYYDWDDWDPQHRHQSHLIGLYPGHQITTEGTPELAVAARRSLEIKGDHTTGWSTGWRINLWARLHDAAQAYHIYQKLLTYVSPDDYRGPDRRRSGGTYPNLLDAHPPFQIDGNFGGTAGVCEMLLQSGDGVIELLPALPKEWNKGSVTGLRARGGYTVDIKWSNGRVTEYTIHATKAGKVTVKYEYQKQTLKIPENGETKVVVGWL